MSKDHSAVPTHTHGAFTQVTTTALVKFLTFAGLTLVGLATAVGLWLLWPPASEIAIVSLQSEQLVTGIHYERGEVLSLSEGCPAENKEPSNAVQGCQTLFVGLYTDADAGKTIEVVVRGPLSNAGLRVGDQIELTASAVTAVDARSTDGLEIIESGAGTSTSAPPTNYGVSGIVRTLPLITLAALCAGVIIWVGRMRGFLALLALGISGSILLAFTLPSLIAGAPGTLVALVSASAIMFVILYMVHGLNMRTTAALIGTLCGILLMTGVSLISIHFTRLSGVSDEAAGFLSAMTSQLDFRGLLTCAIVIAGLGILNDVTITQSSAVWELRAAAPEMTRRDLYSAAMRIGRDHIASTVYTVFFSYVGAALSVLIVMYLYDQDLSSRLTREDLAIEVVRTLCGSIGLVLAVPITTWAAVLLTQPERQEPHRKWVDMATL